MSPYKYKEEIIKLSLSSNLGAQMFVRAAVFILIVAKAHKV